MQLFHVDAFALQPFEGNPAGVCILNAEPVAAWMQSVASELNLSETAFCWPHNNNWQIRFYTPIAEIPLCGHATLSAVFCLNHIGQIAVGEMVLLHSKFGILSAWVEDDGGIVLDFPQFSLVPAVIPPELEVALNTPVKEYYNTEQNWVVAIAPSEEYVENAKPDFSLLLQIGIGQIILSAISKKEGVDYVNRCFVPALGINEDPVTGSAQCALGPYWAGRLCKETLNVFQASVRTGYLQVKPTGNRILIKGRAVLVFNLIPVKN